MIDDDLTPDEQQRRELNEIRNRKAAYARTFMGDDGMNPGVDQAIVLTDLRRFCHADRPTIKISPLTGTVDPIATAVAEGQRQVWLRIMEHLKADPAMFDHIAVDPDA